MGSGVWSANAYQVRVSNKKAKGQDAFAYSVDASAVHPSLNPYGLEVRESRDNSDHPASNSIIVGLDVSGSMGAVVRGIHKDLPQLLGLLNDRTYIQSPQILFSAFSNGMCDKVPLQVGQFEADNRMDENLENMVLGGKLAGGCDARESGELIVYLAARHTSIDCWEKRQRKGYVFLITDEMGYDNVKHKEINAIFGANRLNADIPFKDMVAEAQEKYHLYCVVPVQKQGSHAEVVNWWKSYFDPAHVLELEKPDDVSETIALTIGLTEGNITLDDGLAHLKADGASRQTLDVLKRVLTGVGQGVKGSGLAGSDADGNRGSRRL